KHYHGHSLVDDLLQVMIILFLLGFLGYRKDKPIGTPVSQQFHVDHFLVKGVIGHADDHVITFFIGHLFDPADDRSEKMMNDLRNNDPNGLGLPVFKAQRNVIGFI